MLSCAASTVSSHGTVTMPNSMPRIKDFIQIRQLPLTKYQVCELRGYEIRTVLSSGPLATYFGVFVVAHGVEEIDCQVLRDYVMALPS